MSNTSNRFGLKIFEGTDLVKKDDFNYNWQRIDEKGALKEEVDNIIESLEGRVNTAETDIDSLEGRVNTAEGDIDNLEINTNTHEDISRGMLFDIYQQSFVLDGLMVEKDITINNKLNVASGVIYIQTASKRLRRVELEATVFYTSQSNATYHLEIKPDLSWHWDTSLSGIEGSLKIAEILTDSNGNIAQITDLRPLSPGYAKIRIPRDIYVGIASHGDTVSFPTQKNPPTVIIIPRHLQSYSSSETGNQFIEIEPENITNSSFTVKSGLFRGGGVVTENINSWIYNINDYWTSGELPNSGTSLNRYAIHGYVHVHVVSLQGFPGPLGRAGARLKLQGSYYDGSQWTGWQDLYTWDTYYSTDWNPWSAPEYREWNPTFDVNITVDNHDKWKFRVIFVSAILDNNHFGWVDNAPDIYLSKHDYTCNYLIQGGEVIYYVIPHG